jgi:GSH-dependent disulfide-bond oxidoreductase
MNDQPKSPSSRQAPIALYFWPTPNGRKISIMLEECGLAYEIHPVDIGKGDQFKPEFLAISPNNRMPAIVDPGGPDGRTVSVFESGAILQYLGRKTGKFYPRDERARIAVEEWLFWQVGGLGPMAGQVHHFRNYAPEKIPYAITRYVNELHRLYGVMNRRLEGRDYLADAYSIADIACFPWAKGWERQGQDISEFPNVAAWLARIEARPAVQRAWPVGESLRAANYDLAKDEAAQKILFGQR